MSYAVVHCTCSIQIKSNHGGKKSSGILSGNYDKYGFFGVKTMGNVSKILIQINWYKYTSTKSEIV